MRTRMLLERVSGCLRSGGSWKDRAMGILRLNVGKCRRTWMSMVFEKGEGCCLDACTKYHMSGVLRSGLIAGEGIIPTSITMLPIPNVRPTTTGQSSANRQPSYQETASTTQEDRKSTPPESHLLAEYMTESLVESHTQSAAGFGGLRRYFAPVPPDYSFRLTTTNKKSEIF